MRQGINAVYSKKRGEKTMEQRKKAIICLEGLGKQFQTTNGTVTALDDINLEILQGEIFGIIGLSGAGKSSWSGVSIIWRHRRRDGLFLRDRPVDDEGVGDSESQTVRWG